VSSTILVVEDERKLRELLRLTFERAGFSVLTAAAGAEGLHLAHTVRTDLVVLDLRLPDISGTEVASQIRKRSDVPILILTARTSEEDRIQGFELGADDYLTKPFSPRELVLRANAILRRQKVPNSDSGRRSFAAGRLVIDEERREVAIAGRIVELTPTEWGLVTSLAGVPGRVYSRAELINRIRGYEFDGYERTVDSHVKNLRRKIETDPHSPQIVLTVLGGGYRLGLKPDA
jgi:DNA-binding response OmpR family regulator